MSVLKIEAIEYINSKLVQVARETKALFESGSEDQILLEIEAQHKVYLFLKEKGVETAKKRNLKKLKEMGDATVSAPKRLIETNSAPAKGKRAPAKGKRRLRLIETNAPAKEKRRQTKDEKLEATLHALGLDPQEFIKRMGGKK